jgi:hypothetical protein
MLNKLLMQETKEKSCWISPELYILDFKNTSSGALTGPVEDANYSGTQAGS